MVVAAAPNGEVSFASEPTLVPLTRLVKRLRAPGLAASFALAAACSTPLAGEPPLPEPTPAPVTESDPAEHEATLSPAPDGTEPVATSAPDVE